jgi:eukaryotic-like serine/threonine-protein kinase
MAEVWRARDETLGRDVALKRLHPFLLLDAADRDRLTAEARAVASLAHPNTVTLFDVVSDDSETALVLELVDGESLADKLGRGDRPTRDEAFDIVDGVAAALAAAHALGIVHRDVKPGNVLIDRSGRARLVDFGIARALGDGDGERPPTMIGTAPYMAPEQLRGDPVSPATDAYGLAVVAYDLIAGRRPFEASAPIRLAERQAAGPPPIEGAPLAVNELFAAALSVHPSARPAAVDFAARLRGAFEGRSVGPAAPVLVASSAGSVATLRSVDATSPGAVPPARRRRRGPLVAAAILLGVLLVALLGAAGDRSGAPLSSPAGFGASGSATPDATPRATPKPTPKPTATPAPRPARAGGDDHGDNGKGHHKKGDDGD